MGISLLGKVFLFSVIMFFSILIGIWVWDWVWGSRCQREQLEDFAYVKALAWGAGPGTRRSEPFKVQPCVKWIRIDYTDPQLGSCEYAIHFAFTLRSETFCEQDRDVNFVTHLDELKPGHYEAIIESETVTLRLT